MKTRKPSKPSAATSTSTGKTGEKPARTRSQKTTRRTRKTAQAEAPETATHTPTQPAAKTQPAARAKRSSAARKPVASARATTKRKPATKPAAPAATPGPEPSESKPARKKRPAASTPSETAGDTRKPARRTARAARVPKLPPILFEPDEPAPPPVSGPGEKFALGPTPPEPRAEVPEPELPEAYGTKRLHLTACDPHRLYAYWDFTAQQQAHYNRLSADGHLLLRIYAGAPSDPPALEIHLHPESRHWFARVEQAATPYTAELGYYRRAAGGRRWTRLAVSPTVRTPPETLSSETAPEFATIPTELTFQQIRAMAGAAGREPRPLVEVAQELRRAGHPRFQPATPPGAPAPTPEQQRALEELLGQTAVRWTTAGSIEIAQRVGPGVETLPAAAAELPTSPPTAVWSISSPSGGEIPAARGFWLNVNAELIVYGATEPGAHVTLDGQPITLRPDGSFSCRFALPDGRYQLHIVAVSPDRTETRAVELKCSRATRSCDGVGVQPADPNLKPPATQDA